MFSSGLSEHLCRQFIPQYATMAPAERTTAKHRFFDSGQVCSDEDWQTYQREVKEGTRMPTKLLVVEGGCDGFQPFRRRIWSTWMWGYRLVGVNWALGNLGQMEIVTAICEGATEGKAAHIVAALDAQEFIELSPPSADERERGCTDGMLSPPCVSIMLVCVPSSVSSTVCFMLHSLQALTTTHAQVSCIQRSCVMLTCG
jgi:hypothetical protein